MIGNGASSQREIEMEVAAFFTQIEVMRGAEFIHLLAVGSSCIGASNVGLRSTSRRVMVANSSVKGWKRWVVLLTYKPGKVEEMKARLRSEVWE
jgi:hypothetical protein